MIFILFIIVIVFAFWISSLSNRISYLEKRQKQGVLPAASSYSPAAGAPPPPPFLSASSDGYLKRKSSGAETGAEPKAETQDDTELATGWLNKIGIVAIVLGMAFFFKYAIDQGWIGPWTRIIIGFVVGSLFVYLGELWKEKYGDWAKAGSGGGIALLYFTVYAAYGFYSLIPQTLAFVLFLGIGALATWLSMRHKSLALGVLGFFGAYGAPVVLGLGKDQQGFLFAYLSILNIAAMVILTKRYWVELLLLALAGTGFNFMAWSVKFTNPENTYASLYFVIFTVIVYVIGSALLLRYHHKEKIGERDRNLGVFNILTGLFYFVSTTLLLSQNFEDLQAPVALVGGVLFLFGYALVDRLEYRFANYTNSLAAAALLTAALIWQYDGLQLALAFLFLGAFGMTLGALLNREELRVWSVMLLFLSIMRGIAEPYQNTELALLFNQKFGLMLSQTVVFLYTGWLYSRVPVTHTEKDAGKVMYLVSALLLWFAVSWEIVNFYSGNAQNLFLSLWWIVYAVFLLVLSSIYSSGLFRKTAIALFALSIVKVFLYDSQALDTPYRIIAFIVLGVILLSVSFAYQKNKGKIVEFIEGEKK
jgi:uncharacterized membrane protein